MTHWNAGGHGSGWRDVSLVCRRARLKWLDNDGGAITENLRGAHHRAGIVSNAHDGVCTHLSRMREHQLKRLFACGFTKFGENPSPATEESPQPTDDTHGQ